jgi:micrococcal nuclease
LYQLHTYQLFDDDMNRIFLLISFCLLVILETQASSEITGKVTNILDGNTLEIISTGNETYKISLLGVDSPELTQEYGEKAKKFLEKLAHQKEVVVQLQGKDRWGNHLGIVLLKGSIDLRIELLQEGLAWTSEKNPLPELEEHRTKAQVKGKGLWKQNNPTPPWIYRREQSMLQAKSS